MKLSTLTNKLHSDRRRKQFQKARKLTKRHSKRQVLATRNLAKDTVH